MSSVSHKWSFCHLLELFWDWCVYVCVCVRERERERKRERCAGVLVQHYPTMWCARFLALSQTHYYCLTVAHACLRLSSHMICNVWISRYFDVDHWQKVSIQTLLDQAKSVHSLARCLTSPPQPCLIILIVFPVPRLIILVVYPVAVPYETLGAEDHEDWSDRCSWTQCQKSTKICQVQAQWMFNSFDYFQLFYPKPYSDIPAGTIVYWILASFTDNFYILARPRKIEWLREYEWTDEAEKKRSG